MLIHARTSGDRMIEPWHYRNQAASQSAAGLASCASRCAGTHRLLRIDHLLDRAPAYHEVVEVGRAKLSGWAERFTRF